MQNFRSVGLGSLYNEHFRGTCVVGVVNSHGTGADCERWACSSLFEALISGNECLPRNLSFHYEIGEKEW